MTINILALGILKISKVTLCRMILSVMGKDTLIFEKGNKVSLCGRQNGKLPKCRGAIADNGRKPTSELAPSSANN